MPNSITKDGIEIKSLNDILQDLTNNMQSLYGNNINLASNSSDGQWLNIIATSAYDQLQLIQSVHNNFDPDTARGTILDLRCAINGIQRKKGTYTIQPIVITTDRALTLIGLEDTNDTAFSVSDDQSDLPPAKARSFMLHRLLPKCMVLRKPPHAEPASPSGYFYITNSLRICKALYLLPKGRGFTACSIMNGY